MKAEIKADGIHVYVENEAEEWAVKAILSDVSLPQMRLVIHTSPSEWADKINGLIRHERKCTG